MLAGLEMLLPGLRTGAVDVAVLAVEVLGRGVDLAMLTVSFLSFLVFLACFMLIML